MKNRLRNDDSADRDRRVGHAGAPRPTPEAWHTLDVEETARRLGVSASGVSDREAEERLARFGPNRLEPPAPPSRLLIALRQFRSPLIYLLLAAAAIAQAIGETSDAAFIAAVLLLNAAIGFVNELRAEREVQALRQLVRTRARVHRGHRVLDVDAEALVPGDLLLLESGARVGADVRLSEAHGLRVDESFLTGESVPVDKDAGVRGAATTPVAERRNMAFTGSLVVSGRAQGLVVATGTRTEVGSIARQMADVHREPPPLLRRMERFARRVGYAALGLIALLIGLGLARGLPFQELLLGSIALAVSAIPEGLPIALTVALAVAVSRMVRRRVVVRHLPAVEALGSCGTIVTDKTGTLTQNELTVERVVTGALAYQATGVGYAPEGQLLHDDRPALAAERPRLFRLLRAGCLANEATLSRREDDSRDWEWSGDPTDVALLSLGVKAGCDPVDLAEAHEPLAAIPFEPELRYAASFHRRDAGGLVCVKGAPERVLEMCEHELDAAERERVPLDRGRAHEAVHALMRRGYRVLALADAETPAGVASGRRPPDPSDLVFLGLVAMTDPPRQGVEQAIADCRHAGVRVVMVTGDHATTAAAIAERIGLAPSGQPVVTGGEIEGSSDAALAERLVGVHVVARAAPADKLRVVRALQQQGAFVAVTGDGVNDAPALRQADLGVAMGRSGTDVAREAADVVLTDDDFTSIVAGIQEGRFAYDNVRKVTYLLISTGLGEVLAVTTAVGLGLGVPFTAVQLLWLNLVTNGIQDVALAFEPGEPGALDRPPRPPRQGIFDRLMLERTLLAGVVFGGLGCWLWWASRELPVESARNLVVQLFVLFEIFHIGNARSETRSIFRLSPLRNRLLLVGTLGAVAVHVAALYTPFTQQLLGIAPLGLGEWLRLGAIAGVIVVVMELHKVWRRRFPVRT